MPVQEGIVPLSDYEQWRYTKNSPTGRVGEQPERLLCRLFGFFCLPLLLQRHGRLFLFFLLHIMTLRHNSVPPMFMNDTSNMSNNYKRYYGCTLTGRGCIVNGGLPDSVQKHDPKRSQKPCPNKLQLSGMAKGQRTRRLPQERRLGGVVAHSVRATEHRSWKRHPDG